MSRRIAASASEGDARSPAEMTSDEIEQLIAQLAAERQAAEAAIDAIEARRAGGILKMSDAEIEEIDDAIAKAERRRSRAIQRRDEASALLPVAREREREGERRVAWHAAIAARAQIDLILAEEYRPLVASLRALVGKIEPLNSVIDRHRDAGAPADEDCIDAVRVADLLSLREL